MNDGPADGSENSRPAVKDDSFHSATAPLRFHVYVFVMLIIPALFLASSIPIVRSASFPWESGDPFLLNPDYPFSLKHVNCDVVIYGDSTALTGLDPTVVSRATGLKTCNIAQSRSIVEILGTLALDTYLQNNAPPKFIVMQFAPETLSRDKSNFFWPEGLTLLLRKRSVIEALSTFIRHPAQAYDFAIWAIKAKVTSFIRPSADFASTQAIFRSRGGVLILPKPHETHCVNNIAYVQPSADWVHRLKDRYSSDRTRVLINVSPLPSCSPIASLVAEGTRNVTDNPLSLYPIGFFCDLDRHLTLEGAERASLELAAQLSAGTRP